MYYHAWITDIWIWLWLLLAWKRFTPASLLLHSCFPNWFSANYTLLCSTLSVALTIIFIPLIWKSPITSPLQHNILIYWDIMKRLSGPNNLWPVLFFNQTPLSLNSTTHWVTESEIISCYNCTLYEMIILHHCGGILTHASLHCCFSLLGLCELVLRTDLC